MLNTYIFAKTIVTFWKAPFLYQHVIGHNYATIQQFKESRDKKNIYMMSYPVSRV